MSDDPVFVYLANRTQDRQNFGGHLVATHSRIAFAPTPTNEALGGQHWSADLSSVREVGTMRRTWNLRDGGCARAFGSRWRTATTSSSSSPT